MSSREKHKEQHFTRRESDMARKLMRDTVAAVENTNQAQLREQYWLRGTVGSTATEQTVSTPPQPQTETVVQREISTTPEPQPVEPSQAAYIEAITNPETEPSRVDAEREAREMVDAVYRDAGLDFPTQTLKFEEPAGV